MSDESRVRMSDASFVTRPHSSLVTHSHLSRITNELLPRVVTPLRVPDQLRRVEVHGAEVPGAVPDGLIIEMLRRRMPAFSARRHGDRPHTIASEFDDRDETVSTRAVHSLRAGIPSRAIRGERTPAGRRERYRNARCCVVECLHDVGGETLEAVDLAPWRLPRAEVRGQAIGCRRKRLEPLLRGRA